jgi:hypothetical protein
VANASSARGAGPESRAPPHLRGRRYPFDVFSDIDPARLDRQRLETYLKRYRNPRFVAFARGVLGLA